VAIARFVMKEAQTQLADGSRLGVEAYRWLDCNSRDS
jgi:hypothetical protein